MNEPEAPREPAPPTTAPESPAEAQPFAATIKSIWERIKHHKLVQWTLAYMAIAYTLLHGAEMLGNSFGWPHGLLRAFTWILVLGIPVVMTLAWYHGARGQQRVSGTEVMIIALLLAVGGAVVWRDSTDHEQASGSAAVETVSKAAPPVASDARPSIAVLPFENRSRLEDDAYFVDGIHDDILTQLSKISALRVISRTSVERFRDSKPPLREIAKQLGVTSILEGAVQRAGKTVRINVQLIDASDDTHRWADSYDRELTAANIFAIQSDVAAAIAGELRSALTAGELARLNSIPTRSLEAWQVYQRGKQRLGRRTSASLTDAEAYFREAIALDSSFALAHVGLADALRLQTVYGSAPKDSTLSNAEQSVNRALQLDRNLAEAWASAGGIANNRQQYDQAEEKLRRALALNSNYAPALHWLSITLTELGRHAEALSLAERAVKLDPLSAIINSNLGGAAVRVGRLSDALAVYRQAIEIDPAHAVAYSMTGKVYAYGLGNFDTGMAWLQKAGSLDQDNAEYAADLTQAYWDLGDDAEAQRQLARTVAIGKDHAAANTVAALLSQSYGEVADARRYAEKAAALSPEATFLMRDYDIRKGNYVTARARYAKAFPELFRKEMPTFNYSTAFAAIDLAPVLQHTGERAQARKLLDQSEAFFRDFPRMGFGGYGISDVAIYSLRGDIARALAKLREAEKAGWRGLWRYHRDFDPNLASIRNEAEFEAIFADIERDMARQRTALSRRPQNALLDFTVSDN